MLMFILGFILAWSICGTILFINDEKIICPDRLFGILSLPIQIITLPYFLLKK